jgi:hypothetical protein
LFIGKILTREKLAVERVLVGGKEYALPGKGTVPGKDDSRVGDQGLGEDQAVQGVLKFPQGIGVVILPESAGLEDAEPGIPVSGNNHIIQRFDGGIERHNPAVELVIYMGQLVFQGKIEDVPVYGHKKDKQEEGKEEKDKDIPRKNRMDTLHKPPGSYFTPMADI